MTPLILCNSAVSPTLDVCLQKLWEVDEVLKYKIISKESKQCKETNTKNDSYESSRHFTTTFLFRHSQRFWVSRITQALQRIKDIESWLNKNKDFMLDYIAIGHIFLLYSTLLSFKAK